MSSEQQSIQPKPLPDLQIPKSDATVDVRMINSTGYGTGHPNFLMTPTVKGHDTFTMNVWVFLISNPRTKSHVLFDLGIRKDWRTGYPPVTMKLVGMENPPLKVEAEKNIQDILDEDDSGLGIRSSDITSVVWSHHHFDHRGDMRGVPNAEIVVGPGFCDKYLPSYPTNPDGEIHEHEIKGKSMREIGHGDFKLSIGSFPAYDFFGDGSFYLLSSPGHTVGHLCALARVTPTTFVFMGGDCAHYPGIFRPTQYLPLPEQIPVTKAGQQNAPISMCPGAWIQQNLHPKQSATEPFYEPAAHANIDMAQTKDSIGKMSLFDASDDVLVCIAHDASLAGEVDLYPQTLNDWKAKKQSNGTDCKQNVRWKFVSDFAIEEGLQ